MDGGEVEAIAYFAIAAALSDAIPGLTPYDGRHRWLIHRGCRHPRRPWPRGAIRFHGKTGLT